MNDRNSPTDKTPPTPTISDGGLAQASESPVDAGLSDLRERLRQREQDAREAQLRAEQLRLELQAREAAHEQTLRIAVAARETAIRDDFGPVLTALSFARRGLRRGVAWIAGQLFGRGLSGSGGGPSSAATAPVDGLYRHVFDAAWYTNTYPDAKFSGGDPLRHFLSTGWRDGRSPGPLFDTAWYLGRYRDVAAARINPLLHFLHHGGAEGRSPSPLFDTRWYLRRYPDVAASGINPLVHYIVHGAAEGRDPCEWFDTDWYVARNPAAGAAGINPLVHYATEGVRAGRDPHEMFDSAWYLECHPEAANTGMTPLAHFLAGHDCNGSTQSMPTVAYARRVLEDRQRFAVELPEVLRHIAVMLYRPTFMVIVDGGDTEARARSLESLRGQVYDRWRILDRDETVAVDRLATSEDDFVAWIRAGDILNAKALYAMAAALNGHPTADVVYGDEDCADESGRRSRPFHKPDWSPDTLESFNYIGPGACFRGTLAAAALRESHNYYDFVLRVAERVHNVRHVREVLCHRAAPATVPVDSEQASADIGALTARLRRTGRDGAVTPAADGVGCYDVTSGQTGNRSVSVVVALSGGAGRGDDRLVDRLEAIASRSGRADTEFVVACDATPPPDLVDLLRGRGGKLVRLPDGTRGRPAALNLGAAAASGGMLLFLAVDAESAASDWLDKLLAPFAKQHVGAAGGKLVDRDGRTLHVGIASVKGRPVHVRRGYPRDDLGYFFSSRATRNVSAVTGDCLMTDAGLFRHLGGFNEQLPDGLYDVDYCFKVREAGRTIVVVPAAEFTRSAPTSDAVVAEAPPSEYFQHRWAGYLTSDSFYNEAALANDPATYELEYGTRWL